MDSLMNSCAASATVAVLRFTRAVVSVGSFQHKHKRCPCNRLSFSIAVFPTA